MTKIEEILATNPYLIPAVVSFHVQEDKVLLIHRLKTSGGLGQDLVSGIGGKVGDEEAFKDETPDEAIVREVEEEIKVTPTAYHRVGRVRFLWQGKPSWSMDVTIYVVTAWSGEPCETSVARPVWHPISNLPKENMWEDNSYWVPRVLAGEIIDAVFLYEEDKTMSECVFL